MILKFLFSLAACGFVGCSFAQTMGLGLIGDPDIEAALTTLREQPDIYLQLQGTISVGGKVTSVVADQFWSEGIGPSGPGLVQSELLEYLNGAEVGRVVADGNSVWSYNLLAHEYHTGLYGRYDSSPLPATYLTDALTMLRSGANEFGAFTSRLLNQTYGGNVATFQSWVPGSAVTEIPNPKIPNMVDVTYSLGTPVRRRVVFHLMMDAESTQLASIDYFDTSKYSGGLQRVVAWTLTPYTVIPSSADYRAYTASQIAGWRIVTSGS